VLAVATIPREALFWYGFALPIPPLLALIRVVLVIAAWPVAPSPGRQPEGLDAVTPGGTWKDG
jgi:hypothetical protein